MSSIRIRAERALLGSVLTDPAAHQNLLDLVHSEDFERLWHAQVLAAMQRLRAGGVLPEAAAVYREIQSDPDLPATVARDGVLLVGLIEGSPRTAHAGAYAAMVVEGGLRERVGLAGSRLYQSARSGDLQAALGQGAEAGAIVDACRSRWAALPAEVRRQLPSVPNEQTSAQLCVHTGAGRTAPLRLVEVGQGQEPKAPPSPRLHSADTRLVQWAHTVLPAGRDEASAETAGLAALRDLAAAPSQIDRVQGWLRAEHFARREHGQLYAVMRDLNACRQPVDPLTICWEAHRRGLAADPNCLSDGTGAFAVARAREVYRLGMLAGVERAGVAVQADAGNPALSPPRMLASAAARIRELYAQPDRERVVLADLAPSRDGRGEPRMRSAGREAAL